VLLALILALATHPIHVSFFPDAQYRWVLIGLASVSGSAMLLMRNRFTIILLVFACSAFGVDVLQATVRQVDRWRTRSGSWEPRSRPEHVLYLVLDEQIGLGGFPKTMPECLQAAEELQRVLMNYNFTVYPYAFSNYRSSWDSIPSILNDALVPRTGYYSAREHEMYLPVLKTNGLFERYAAKNYSIFSYHTDYIDLNSPLYEITARKYNPNSVATLHSIPIPWYDRLRHTLVIYAQTDRFLWAICESVVPQRYRPERLRVSSLAASDVWPDRLLDDIRQAEKNGLFLVHLTVPHNPYVYTANGSVKHPDEWRTDHEMVNHEHSEYVDKYRSYCDQVRYLARQLDEALNRLSELGILDSMTAVVHGDHGSRIRIVRDNIEEWKKLRVSTPDCAAVARYDYVSKPELEDLVNRFSTLLAVKAPGAEAPEIVEEFGSVLFFMRTFFDGDDVGQDDKGLNSVYLFNADGTPRAIPFGEMWREGGDQR
jgi:hypothetical protein